MPLPENHCQAKITIGSGVMRNQRVFCSRKAQAGQDYCGNHLARMPYLRKAVS